MVSLTGAMSSIFQRTILAPATIGDFYLIANGDGNTPYGNAIYKNTTLTGSSSLTSWTDITSTFTSVVTGLTSTSFTDIDGDRLNNLIFFVGSAGFNAPRALRSTNFGSSWVDATSSLPSSTVNYNSVSFGNGLWILGNDTGQIFSSPDTVTWTLRFTGVNIIDTRFTNNRWLAFGADFSIYTSLDGITWSSVHSALFTYSGPGNPSIIARFNSSNGLFMTAFSESGTPAHTLQSSNGTAWTSVGSIPSARFFMGLEHFDNSTYVAVGENFSGSKKAWFSADSGSTWTQVTDTNAPGSGFAGSVSGIVKANDIIITGFDNYDLTSVGVEQLRFTTNGSTWAIWPVASGISSGVQVIKFFPS